MDTKAKQPPVLSFFIRRDNNQNRQEIILLADTLKNSDAQKIEIPDFSVKSNVLKSSAKKK